MKLIHKKPSPLVGKTVRIKKDVEHFQVAKFGGSEYRVEDWWDRIAKKSWMDCTGNAACLVYAWRAGMSGLLPDDEVLYGKVGDYGHLVHISEIEEESNENSI